MNATSGVYYFNGRKETYYSSKVLYHKDTCDWLIDSEGCYRDNDGYYVVASNDYEKGEIIKMSKGLAKIYDCGCDNGTLDIYVNW